MPVCDGEPVAVAVPDELPVAEAVCVAVGVRELVPVGVPEPVLVRVDDPVAVLVAVVVSVELALRVRDDESVGERVRLRVLVAVGVNVCVGVVVGERVADGDTSGRSTGGSATPRSCWSAGASYTSTTRAVALSMRNTCRPQTAYTTNMVCSCRSSRRPVMLNTGEPGSQGRLKDARRLQDADALKAPPRAGAGAVYCATWPAPSSVPSAAHSDDAFSGSSA